MKKQLTVLAIMAMSLVCCKQQKNDGPAYLNPDAALEERVESALSLMTLEEKVAIIHAQSKFSSAGVPRLGIPELWCTDGPHGIRAEVLWDEWRQAGWTNDSIIAFPALSALAATWDKDMSALYGKSIGEEARYREKDVLLGPGVNIYRTPLNGRNFEYMGEDPCLAGKMVVPYIQEVQKNGVATCVKHYALNNEETYRHTTDVDLDDRALYEIYLPAFKAAVQEGGSWTIMSSYNNYRGQHVSHNKRLLCDILKEEWGFDGAVISDWGGVHNTLEAIHNGMDLEFGTWTNGLTMGKTNAYSNYFLADPYLKLIKEGKVGTTELDDKCRRVLRTIFRTAMRQDKPYGAINSEAHYAAARTIGANGIVLLKNEGNLLPIDGNVKKIAVIGENAIKMMTVGGGSSSLKCQHEILLLDGIRERAGKDIEVVYERGYVGSVLKEQDGLTVKNIVEERSSEQLVEDALEAARNADMVIFVGGLNKDPHQDSEGRDRLGLELPYGQDALIEAISQVNKNMVVAIVSGNAVAMPWVDKVPAIVQTWYLGSEAGHSFADVIFGDVNPSGKLPFTFPKVLADSPAHFEGKPFPNRGKTYYDEGIFVGYRWFEHKNIEPLFAFGHGLSYTTFEYSDAKISRQTIRHGGKLEVSVKVKNTGDREGAEIVQLYISDKESRLERPEKELKDFAKISLKPSESKTVKFRITEDMLKYFDDAAHEWVAEDGDFVAHIAAASDDVKASLDFKLQ